MDDQLELSASLWELVGLQVTAGSNTIPTATVTLRDSAGEKVQDASVGDGPVDAIYSAGIDLLNQLPFLSSLSLEGTQVTPEGRGRLKLAHFE